MPVKTGSNAWVEADNGESMYEEVNEFFTKNHSKAFTAEEILLKLDSVDVENATMLDEMLSELIENDDYKLSEELSFISRYIRTQEIVTYLEYLVGERYVEKRIVNNQTYYATL